MKKKFNSFLLKSFFILFIGICMGIFWHWLYIFPFPQLHAWKHKINKDPISRYEQPEVNKPGRWRKIKNSDDNKHFTDEQKKMIKNLKSIGYLTGSQAPPPKKNVTIYNKEKAYDGLNLVTSAHAPEAVIMDMEGNVLHKWSCKISRAWPDFKPEKPSPRHSCWRRSYLMENGDLIVIFAGSGLVKLDKESNIIWTVFNHAHHDLYIAENGNIYVLTREAHINEKYNKEKPILEDYICILDPDGNQLNQISILETIEKSKFSPILNRLESWGDITHTNTIELIEHNTSIPYFSKGRILISILGLDLICVVDINKGVVWAESDLWSQQHQPTLLDNGHLLILDNKGINNKSRVIEFDPVSRKFYWVYGGIEEEPFYTPTCGSCQRLPNGNTLITESDPGRAFEVTFDKSIVWEYYNPQRAGENDEYIATLSEVVRIESKFTVSWLK